MDKIITAATALLKRIDDITTEDFRKGGERAEREALREALVANMIHNCGYTEDAARYELATRR